jgi:Polysaccharide lyase/Ca-dependent carbohydrate-binding module xylan-binding/Bacterial Ig domain
MRRVFLLLTTMSVALAMSAGVALAATILCRAALATDAARFEAESMSYGSFASVVSSVGASGAKALRYEDDGTATKRIVSSLDATKVVVRARNSDYSTGTIQRVRVLVDGIEKGTLQLRSRTYEDYTFSATIPAGTHTISVAGLGLENEDAMLVDTVTLVASDGATTPTNRVIWKADAELPVEQEWASGSMQGFVAKTTYSGVVLPRVKQVSSPVLNGTKSYRIELYDGDDSYGERAEIAQGNPTRSSMENRLFNEGDERWIAFAIKPGEGFHTDPASWWVSMQIKQLGSYGSPVIELDPDNGVWEHHRKTNDPNNEDPAGFRTEFVLGSINRNGWNKFLYHVKFSPDPRVGMTEIWMDNGDGRGMVQVLAPTAGATMKINPTTGETIRNHARIGLYRNPTISGYSVAYYDSFTVATTRAAAEASF